MIPVHGERKAAAEDAFVIAQTLRMRSDPSKISMADRVQTELKVLTAQRIDMVDERPTILRLQTKLAAVEPPFVEPPLFP